MEQIMAYLPLLIPVFLVQLILMLVALIHLLRNKKVKIFNVPIWIVVILVVNIIGPVLYLIFGRVDE